VWRLRRGLRNLAMNRGSRPPIKSHDTPMMRRHWGVRKEAFLVAFAALFWSHFEAKKRPLFGRGSGCFAPLEPGQTDAKCRHMSTRQKGSRGGLYV
jgi:hypothetical protein